MLSLPPLPLPPPPPPPPHPTPLPHTTRRYEPPNPPTRSRRHPLPFPHPCPNHVPPPNRLPLPPRRVHAPPLHYHRLRHPPLRPRTHLVPRNGLRIPRRAAPAARSTEGPVPRSRGG